MTDDYEALRMSLSERKKKEVIHKPIINNIGESIDFGFQAVNQIQVKEFVLENQNDYQVEWNFESEVFNINPSVGYLAGKGGRQIIQITFNPVEASAILNTIILNIEKEQPRIVKVSGIGKYAYIQAQARKIHFDKLLIGKTLTREVIIKNLSQVGTHFTIEKVQSDEFKDQSFSINTSLGYIPPHQSFLISITYKPTVIALSSITHWIINAPGGNSQEITALGEAEGFDVKLSQSSINFGEVKIETETSRILTIQNESELATKYQFYNDQFNIFRLSNSKGVVKANSYVRILVTFQPRHTISYYQRVFCMIQNHKILHVDLLGTCYDLLFKPLPIVQSHIDIFRQRVIDGRLSNIDLRYIENSLLIKLQKNSPMSKHHPKNSSQPLGLTNATEFSVNTGQQMSQYQHNGRSLHNHSQSNLYSSTLKVQPSQQKAIQPNNRYGQSDNSPSKDITKNKSLLKEKSQLLQPTNATQSKNLLKSSAQGIVSNAAINNKQNNIFLQQIKGSITTSGTLESIGQNQQQQFDIDKIPERYEEETSNETNQISLHREIFLNQSSKSRLIRISEEFLDFQYQEFMTLSKERTLTIHNNLNCKITIFWTLQKKNSSIDSSLSVFSVQPETASIKPNSTTDFQITFRPIKNAFYFYQDLQFIAYKYSEKLTKNVVDDFQRQLMTQSMKMTKDQFSLTHSQSQHTLRNSTNMGKLNKMDYIADETIPPFSGYVSCIGHSFAPFNQIYIPMIQLQPSNNVYFNSCRSGEVAFQSIEICNQGDTPVYFRIQKDQHSIFSVFPQIGLIQPKSFALLVLQFSPQQPKKYEYSINIVFNHNNSNVKTINLFGFCSEPIVDFENDGRLFFPPSSLGVYSKQKMKIENRSKINIQYEIEIPSKYKEELYFEPSSGIMKSNEHIYVTCGFVPYSKKSYKIKPIFKAKEILDLSQSMVGYFMPGSGNSELQQRLIENDKSNLKQIEKQFEVYAKGADGLISIKPEAVDFGIVKVNFSQRITAQIQNDSSCTFFIEVRLVNDDEIKEDDQVEQDIQQQSQVAEEDKQENRSRKSAYNKSIHLNQDEESQAIVVKDEELLVKRKKRQMFDQDIINQNFKLDFYEGIISANSKIDIGITFSPNQVNLFNLKLEVIATEKNPNASIHRSSNKLFLHKTSLKVVANGNYPLLKIIDVRNDAISVASLWQNFQINKINQELATDLNEHEINFLRIEQLNIEQAQKLQKQLKNYTWNFGYIPNNKNVKPRKIVVTIQNIGGTELDFNFKLPSDSQIDLEPWADPGELQGDEAYEKALIDRKIFQIIPKSGTLKPQQLQDIQLIYSPGNIDDGFQILSQRQERIQSENHLLRVVLQINNGKPLVINLKGMMLSPTQGMLSVKQSRINLPDCPIGMLQPLKYPIEIQNVGLTKLNYSIEVQEIDQKGQNIDSKFQIFNISNRSGSLMPNEKQYLYCLFKPLETKKYYHILTIQATDFMKPLKDIRLHVIGEGFSKIPKKIVANSETEYPQQRSSVSAIGSKVCFSIEEIDFGNLKPLEQAHRLIILYNLSTDEKLSFDFTQSFSIQTKAPGLVCDDKFQIEPSQGRLNPGEFIELKLTLEQAYQPSVYSGEIECTIYWGNHEMATGGNNRMVTTMTSVSSHSGLEKETLFLRIKKASKFSNKLQKAEDELTIQNHKDHMIMTIIGSAIKDILNDDTLFDVMKRIDYQPVQLYKCFDTEEPANIQMVSSGETEFLDASGIVDDILNDLKENNNNQELKPQDDQDQFNFNEPVSFSHSNNRSESKLNGKQTSPYKQEHLKDYRQLFLQNEFIDLVDLIFENTYFNIIQEATRKECDLLRLGKNFIMSNTQK